jgi:hypothetical protein
LSFFQKVSVFFTFSSFLFPESLPHNNTQHKGKAFRATTQQQQQQRAQTLCAIQSSAGRKKSERD